MAQQNVDPNRGHYRPRAGPVKAGDLLDDGETETGARDTAGNTGFDSFETIEDPGRSSLQ